MIIHAQQQYVASAFCRYSAEASWYRMKFHVDMTRFFMQDLALVTLEAVDQCSYS